MNCKNEFERWLYHPRLDEKSKAELFSLGGDNEKILSRFGSTLNFGTAGLRGIMGVGTNRMNIYTVRQASFALGKFIRELGPDSMKSGVVIAYDSRNNGRDFVENTALTLCSLGIRVFVFDNIRPTPELSFAVRFLGATAGVNITASHNPKEYNGYKVYYKDGAQINEQQAKKIYQIMLDSDPLEIIPADKNDAINHGLYNVIGENVDDAFVKSVLSEKLELGDISADAKKVSIVYSAFHGTGYKLVPRVLEAIGANVTVVEEQNIPDGDFPTLRSPNPEEKDGLSKAIELAKNIGSELVIATDPDADRCASAVVLENGDVRMISGNQMGVLLADFIFTVLSENGKLPVKPAVISTIVSTLMIKKVCETNGIDYFEVLTGFKYIGELVNNFEINNSHSFLLGFEESCGYLKGGYARDKDAVLASMLISQMAMFYKNKGMNLSDALNLMYEKYGYYLEKTVSFSISGASPMEKMSEIMSSIRSEDCTYVADTEVLSVRDYKKSIIKEITSGKCLPTNLPVSDVYYYELADGCSVIVRPSGTEPKIKLYVLTNGESLAECESKICKYVDYFSSKLK